MGRAERVEEPGARRCRALSEALQEMVCYWERPPSMVHALLQALDIIHACCDGC